jgi:hypothetical protein
MTFTNSRCFVMKCKTKSAPSPLFNSDNMKGCEGMREFWRNGGCQGNRQFYFFLNSENMNGCEGKNSYGEQYSDILSSEYRVLELVSSVKYSELFSTEYRVLELLSSDSELISSESIERPKTIEHISILS